jgi:hypothetical protein
MTQPLATADWQPFREPLRVTIARTVSIAVVAGAVAALAAGRLRLWPAMSLLMLWPSNGGHWIDLFFLNVLRPRLPKHRPLQWIVRVAVWFAGGIVLALGVRLTARIVLTHWRLPWLTWATAGAVFVLVELVAHAGLHLRGRPSFYSGLG